MKIKNYILIVVSLGLYSLSSCGILSAFKIRDARLKEHIESSHFFQEIPFQRINGQIIITINISGSPKNFIFDTGAHTVIDDSLLPFISFHPLGKTKTFDSNHQKKFLQTIQIDQLSIGEIPIYDIVASTTDFKQFSEISCLDISGIIGVNIMNKGIWQIDYQKNLLIFTDQQNRLSFSNQSNTIHFNTNIYGYPTLPIRVNDIFLDNGLLDTGFNGSILLSEQMIPDSIPSFTQFNYTYALHGLSEASQKIATYPIQLNQFKTDNSIISFNNLNTSALIGNRFLQDYRVTINWATSELILDQVPIPNTSYFNFGFYPTSHHNQIIIGSIYENSELYKRGVRLGDQILSLNQIDLSSNTSVSFCQVLQELKKTTDTEITISVIRKNEVLKFRIKKEYWLQKIFKH
jgi:predicted aspartyl protease